MQKKLETCQSSPVSPCQAGTKCWRGLQEKQHFFFYTLLIHKLKIFMNIRTRTWTLICFLSFKFLTLICSLSFKFFVVCFWVSGHSAFHFQLVQYTFLTARFSATKWGRTYYVLSLKSKISPRWRQVWPSHLFLDLASFVLFCFFVYFFLLFIFFWQIAPVNCSLKYKVRVHGVLWDMGRVYERLQIVQLSLET